MIELSNDLSATRPHSGGKWDNSWLRLNFCGDIRCFDQLPALKFYENPPLRSHMTSLRMRPSSYRRRTARLDELVVKNAPAISNPAISEASRLYRFVFDKAWPITTFCKRNTVVEWALCTAAKPAGSCPLWVRSGQKAPMSALPPKADIRPWRPLIF